MATVTISLPDSLEAFMAAQIAGKGFVDASDYVLSLLLQAQQDERDAGLEALLLEGVASGDGQDVSEEFWATLKVDSAELTAKRTSGAAK
jgi:antitoxin ParD1/3/4